MRRKILAVIVCLAVLLGVVVAYAYTQLNQKNHVETRTFSFEWLPNAQNVTPGKLLQMNITFSLLEDKNLSIVVKVNDLVRSPLTSLGLAMDSYPFDEVFPFCGRGELAAVLFHCFYLFGNEYGHAVIHDSGVITLSGIFPYMELLSDRYYFVYDEDEGYTFYISLPPPEEPLSANWVHISYSKMPFYPTPLFVYVRFQLDLLEGWEI